ncbi:MerR family transcriptional regulator [Ktedonobacter sp. SOSP1-52]|uniref:MerR family transcriptional regulator n=1 Tax=Ktedonobacter sp. SOSP1-52 TaxID=2778366 RepID=UPI0019156156|nr:MerR family transcriptional regulator [Ktedonobacter sp. SOSP1-52]GHO63406.1 MerR family transcriptional regulator [Ktedonobacter sp. SOSP1-52]GHO71459.1 MerR family transcriptional regulator [Ktedonobacter sp. SOSP1-52]
MRIKELEEKTGLTRHTIRFYEKQGFLRKHAIRREGNNYRDYSEETVPYLLMLKAGQAAGFTLAELKELISADEANELSLQRKVELLRSKMKEIDRKKAELDQIQAYLAYKLTLIDPEANGTTCGNIGTIPEMLTGPFSTVWNVCLCKSAK